MCYTVTQGSESMFEDQKEWVLNAVRDITVAKLSNANVSANKDGGASVAKFMEEIYNKLAELCEKADVIEPEL